VPDSYGNVFGVLLHQFNVCGDDDNVAIEAYLGKDYMLQAKTCNSEDL
jgi:hypothetical protein